MKKKINIIIVLICITVLVIISYKYIYLLQSFRNMPVSTEIIDTQPKTYPSIVKLPDQSDPDLSYLSVPEGFSVTYYAKDVPGARSLTLGVNGTVYVGTRQTGAVYALPDENNDGRADARYVVASGLNSPNGVAYKNGDLYVSEIHRIIKFENIGSTYRKNPNYDVVYDQLPTETHHGWRYIAFGPDGLLYIGIGMPCNICDDQDEYGRIIRVDVGSENPGFEVYALGIRNTVGFDWSPVDQTLWFTDNGRDWLGDGLPPDELNHAPVKDLNFGFPYCYGNNIPDPQFSTNRNCSNYSPPFTNLDPHVAALGMKFYRGDMFPDQYKNQIFIAQHGSWNSSVSVGYRVEIVDPATGNRREFLSGFLDESGNASGRPVDILEMNDGSLLVSDDKAGALYRITYRP